MWMHMRIYVSLRVPTCSLIKESTSLLLCHKPRPVRAVLLEQQLQSYQPCQDPSMGLNGPWNELGFTTLHPAHFVQIPSHLLLLPTRLEKKTSGYCRPPEIWFCDLGNNDFVIFALEGEIQTVGNKNTPFPHLSMLLGSQVPRVSMH